MTANSSETVAYTETLCALPPYFDPQKLESLSRYQVAWWDETHHQCCLRSKECGQQELDYVTQFPRASDGTLDIQNGEYRDIRPTKTKVKYDKEIRFALGVAMVQMNDGTVIGKRCKPYDYTNRNIINNEDWERRVSWEIDRVKKLSQKGH